MTWHKFLLHQDDVWPLKFNNTLFKQQVTFVLFTFHYTFLQYLRKTFRGIRHVCMTALVLVKLFILKEMVCFCFHRKIHGHAFKIK
jgi:hypothetical protein